VVLVGLKPISVANCLPSKQSKAKQSKAKQSKAKQSKRSLDEGAGRSLYALTLLVWSSGL